MMIASIDPGYRDAQIPTALPMTAEIERAVLFVDDDKHILTALKRSLRSEPYKVACAMSGRDALKKLAQEEFQVIVTDMGMPQMDGLSLLNAVALQYPQMLRLVLSAGSDAGRIVDAINKGRINQYILKPWQDEDLKIRLRQAFDLWALQSEKRFLLNALQDRNRILEDEVKARVRQIMAVERQAEVGRHAAQIVHNLNNPLHSLSAAIDLLFMFLAQGQLEKNMIERALAIAKATAEDLRDIIASILPTDGHQAQYLPEPVDINRVIEKEMVYFEMIPEFKYKIEKKLSLQENLLPIMGHAIQIKQILNNLIKNAVDAMENASDKMLTIETMQAGNDVVIRVSDTGEGIAQAHLEKIFLPDFTTKPLGQGTGLGLASVKMMVEAYSGRVQVASTMGQGTTFEVQLPAIQSLTAFQ